MAVTRVWRIVILLLKNPINYLGKPKSPKRLFLSFLRISDKTRTVKPVASPFVYVSQEPVFSPFFVLSFFSLR